MKLFPDATIVLVLLQEGRGEDCVL